MKKSQIIENFYSELTTTASPRSSSNKSGPITSTFNKVHLNCNVDTQPILILHNCNLETIKKFQLLATNILMLELNISKN